MTIGDAKDFVAGLARAHGEDLKRFVASRVKNVADVPDVIQDVFLRMLRIPNREAIRSPEAYLFTVALHVAQQHALRASAAPPSVEVTQLLGQLQAAADTDPALQLHAEQCLEEFFINGAGAPAIPGESPNPHVDQSRFSWTVGTNYKLAEDLDFYVRASDGHHFPTFDDVRSQLGQTATQDVLDKPWDVKSEEGGIKFHNRSFDADVTGFYDEVRGAVYNDVGVPPVLAGSNAYGVEIDGRWTSDFGFSLTSDDVWEHSRSCCSAGDPLVDGKQAERIPSYQIRVTPAFRINMGPATVNLFATYAAISKRYGDLQNQQPLPAYETVFAGFMLDIGQLTLQLTGDNLFNSHGLTEGNPRSLGAAVPLYLPDVRPIFGRSVTGSVTVHF